MAWLGVDLGATWLRVALVEDGGRVVRKVVRPSPRSVDELAAPVAELAGEARGIGVASIGPLDLATGWVVDAPNAPMRSFPVVDPLKRVGLPVVLANDAVAAAWGERVWGVGVENLVYVTVSTGLGFGAVVDGCLLLGRGGNAHELGHAVVDLSRRRRCTCGLVGHAEGVASGRGLMLRGAKLGYRDAREVFAMARLGDETAKALVDEFLDYLAAAVATAVQAYDPEVVVVGGSVALRNWDIVGRGLVERLSEFSLIGIPSVRPATFGDDEGVVGAAALVAEVPETLRRRGYPR